MSAWLEWFKRRVAAQLDVQPRSVDELLTVMRGAERRELLSADTLAMAEGALAVGNLQVRDIMVPRANMVTIGEEAAPESFVTDVVRSGHSRFPVVGDDRFEVLGILLAKDLLEYFAQKSAHLSAHQDAQKNGKQRRFDMEDLMRLPVFVPESKRLNVLLREFRESRNHMAIVVDEYGSTVGLVTIEDVLEQIVGEIDDEHDYDELGNIRDLGDGEHIVKAGLSIEDFNEHFSTAFSDEDFDTIGGLIVNAFGHVPARGEELDFEGWHFRVVHAAKRRVHLLWLQRKAPQEADESISTD